MTDLALYVAGQPVDLAPNATISMVINNTLFDPDVLQGSYSYPFTLPATARNKRLFGFPEELANSASLDVELECELIVEALNLSGTLKIREVSDDGYTANVLTQVGKVASQLKTKKLSDLDLGTIQLVRTSKPLISFKLYLDLGATPPAIGTLMNFRVYRQDGTWVFHAVQWRGSETLLRQDIADKINAQTPAAKYPAAYNPATTYMDGDVALDTPTGDIYMCLFDNTVGVPLSDPVKWGLVADLSTWRVFMESASMYRLWEYEDPLDDYAVEAQLIGDFIFLIDNRAPGSSPFDGFLMAAGTPHPAILYQDGIQTGGGDFNTSFFAGVSSMLNGVIGKSWPATTYQFVPIYNPGNYESTPEGIAIDTRQYVNYYLNGGYYVTTSSLAIADFFVPQVFARHVLEVLFAHIGIAFTTELADEFNDLLLYGNTAAVQLAREATGLNLRYLMFAFAAPLSRHVPPITFADFLNGLRQLLFLGFCFDIEGRSCRLVTLKSILQGQPAADWSAKSLYDYKLAGDEWDGFTLSYTHDGGDKLASELIKDVSRFTLGEAVDAEADLPAAPANFGELRLVRETGYYYKPVWQDNNTYLWEKAYSSLQPYGTGTYKYQAKAAPILSEPRLDEQAAAYVGNPDRYWLVPMVSQALTIYDIAKINDCSLRLLYYLGQQPDSQGNDYPLGSSVATRYDGTRLPGYVDLRYDGDHGIYEQLAKEWLAFVTGTKKVTRQVQLTSLDLKRLRPDHKILVAGTSYLWRSIKVTFPITKPAEVEMWRCA